MHSIRHSSNGQPVISGDNYAIGDIYSINKYVTGTDIQDILSYNVATFIVNSPDNSLFAVLKALPLTKTLPLELLRVQSIRRGE